MFQVDLAPWAPVKTEHLIGVAATAAALILLLWLGDPGWTGIVDDANLAFHEAGHMFYGWFGQTAALYGGVLGQLTFPLVAAGIFFVRRQPHAVAIALMWGCQNLWNIARYMADARAQELPLVGGGEHDFANIFTRWGVMHADTTIAAWTRTLGWLGMAALVGWIAWRWRHDQAQPAPQSM
ncbi:MAG: hypothetical protein R3B06_02675 [Kofleriaceae bacterium]